MPMTSDSHYAQGETEKYFKTIVYERFSDAEPETLYPASQERSLMVVTFHSMAEVLRIPRHNAKTEELRDIWAERKESPDLNPVECHCGKRILEPNRVESRIRR